MSQFNETYLLRHLMRRIGSRLYNCFEPKWFIDILNEETLTVYSSYYPKLVKGVKITKECGIETYDPINNARMYHRYIIPKFNPEDEYIGIEKTLFNGQGFEQAYAGFNGPLADAAFSKIRSLMPIPAVRWTTTFIAPHYLEVFPYRQNHEDFVVIMQRRARLEEIPMGLWEYVQKLFVADVKLAIYYEYPNARDSGVLNGVEINTNISEFSNAESDRETVLDKFKEDWYLNPERWDAMLSQAGAE